MASRRVAPTLAMVASDGEGSKRPANTPFKQQTLKAWRPIPDAEGRDHRVRGDRRHLRADRRGDPRLVVDGGRADDPRLPPHLRRRRRRERLADRPQPCNASMIVEKDMHPPIYVYYKLTNYYQNHRRYVKSRNEKQLRGDVDILPKTLEEDCAPKYYYEPASDAVLAARRLRPRLREQRPGARHLAVRADRVVVLQRLLLPQAGRRRLRARGDLPPRHRVGHRRLDAARPAAIRRRAQFRRAILRRAILRASPRRPRPPALQVQELGGRLDRDELPAV